MQRNSGCYLYLTTLSLCFPFHPSLIVLGVQRMASAFSQLPKNAWYAKNSQIIIE